MSCHAYGLSGYTGCAFCDSARGCRKGDDERLLLLTHVELALVTFTPRDGVGTRANVGSAIIFIVKRGSAHNNQCDEGKYTWSHTLRNISLHRLLPNRGSRLCAHIITH